MERRLARKALNHWREWLPTMYADLQRHNMLTTTAAKSAEMAAREIRELMQAGARLDEAEEIVLPKYILLTPEELPEDEGEELTPEELAEWKAQKDERAKRARAEINSHELFRN